MANQQKSLGKINQSSSDFGFGLLAKNSFTTQTSGSESPSSTQESSPKDWMSNLQALEDINKAGLLNVLKVSSQLQSMHGERSCLGMQTFLNKQYKLPEQIEEKIEYTSDEIPLYKKVKVEFNGDGIKSDSFKLSSMVDEQLLKLPKEISEKVQNMLTKAKACNMEKIPKASSSVVQQDDKPLKVLAFKFDEKLKTFKYLVEWKVRVNGHKPKSSFLTKEEMMKIDPGLIISYYEEQVARTFHSVMLDHDDVTK